MNKPPEYSDNEIILMDDFAMKAMELGFPRVIVEADFDSDLLSSQSYYLAERMIIERRKILN